MPLLDIRNLTIEFKTGDEWVKAVDRVSMTLTEGEIRGLVGESGSGKSLIAKAICGVNKVKIAMVNGGETCRIFIALILSDVWFFAGN